MLEEQHVISSQLLMRYEQRMFQRIYALNVALARHIDARWTLQPQSMINLAVLEWRIDLEGAIYRFQELVVREGMSHIFRLMSQKNDELEFLLNFIRPELRRYSQQRAALIEDFLRRRITAELASGETPMQIRQNIVAILSTKNYALRIARTEVHTALERGAWEAANSLGVRITKKWVSREDLVVRFAHALAHGQIRELNAPFKVGGESMMYPGDPSASAKNNVNCRCTVHYELGGRFAG
jgi:hypothetical protein